ncbi:MAG: PilT/PilU family type 4a pilus ATPase [Acidobacteria bacterium]|nr:PilT/PilU family type 4a pilus ATPase [Acidobacteriota bacterium]
MTFDQLIAAASASRASDIHLRAGHAPLVRLNGVLQRWSSVAPLTPGHLEAIASRLLPPIHQERLQTKLEVDVAWQAPGNVRVRASVFRQRGTIAVSMRLIPEKIPPIEQLGLPSAVVKLAQETRGLVLVTGVTGSGKSTTLAALIDLINRTRAEHVLTIEDPIEFVHKDARAVVTQREIGFDTPSYASGLRAALRQDPDVILIGEMRDQETIETALVAAETGHLVFSTLHTLDAPETINRIVAVFPPHQQDQIRTQLARVLRAAVSQRLLPRADGQGRVLAAEVLVSTPYIRDCIVDRDKTSLIADAIVAGGSEYGMQSFDQAILGLCQQQLVTVEEAERWVTNVEEFRMRLRGITPGTAAAVAMGSMTGSLQRFGA